MIEKVLAQYIGVSSSKISRLLTMPQSKIYEDADYQDWINHLDSEELYKTLQYARQAYDKHLPQFTQILQSRYNMTKNPMSSFTLGNWLVGFLRYPNTIIELSKIHNRLPREAVIEMLPNIIAILDEMPSGRADWQKALALMALPLIGQRN